MVRARTLALLPLVLAAPLLVPPLATAAPRPDAYLLPGEDVFPEGITARGRTFYVTSTTDGTVFRGDVKDATPEVFLPGGQDGRTTAIGLEVNRQGDRLVVAGGATGQVFVYDTSDGSLVARYDNGLATTFVNDVAFDREGNAYVTDSFAPRLYRIPAEHIEQGVTGTQPLPTFVDLSASVTYQPGFNANGIVVTPDGRYAVVVQSNTGLLFRVDLRAGTVQRIDLGGARVTAGDGLELRGRTLYVVRNALERIAEVRLSGDLTSGRVVGEITDPSFAFPTTAAIAAGRLLVVNSQFDQRRPGGDPVAFTVSSVKKP